MWGSFLTVIEKGIRGHQSNGFNTGFVLDCFIRERFILASLPKVLSVDYHMASLFGKIVVRFRRPKLRIRSRQNPQAPLNDD